MSALQMSKTVYDQIRASGEQCYPHEACGVLFGRPGVEGWVVTHAISAANADKESPQLRYRIEPLELVRIQSLAAREGLEIAGFYHSHPDHPAQWSPTDLAEAHWLGCSYVITAVSSGKATLTCSFLLAGTREEDKRFEAEVLWVEEVSFPTSHLHRISSI